MAPPLTVSKLTETIQAIEGFALEGIVGEFNGSRSTLRMRHLDCNRIFDISYANMTQRKRCKYCHGQKPRVDEQRVRELLLEKRPDLELVGGFTDIRSHATFKHVVCNTTFSKLVFDVLYNGRQCPVCNGVIPERSEPEMVALMNAVPGYSVVSMIDNTAKPSRMRFLLRHDDCGHKFEVIFHNFFNNGTRCPKCAARYSITPTNSTGVRRIEQWLTQNGIKFVREKRFPGLVSDRGRGLRYDFALSDLPLLIEFDGKQHFQRNKSNTIITEETLARIKLHDERKNQYARDNGYWLLRIRYDELVECETSLAIAVEDVKKWILEQGSTTSREA